MDLAHSKKEEAAASSFLSNNLAKSVKLWYTVRAVDSFQQEGGVLVDILIAFLVSVAAGVVSYYVCKWLDGDRDSEA